MEASRVDGVRSPEGHRTPRSCRVPDGILATIGMGICGEYLIAERELGVGVRAAVHGLAGLQGGASYHMHLELAEFRQIGRAGDLGRAAAALWGRRRAARRGAPRRRPAGRRTPRRRSAGGSGRRAAGRRAAPVRKSTSESDVAAVMTESSGVKPTHPRHRAGVASMA